MRFRHFPVQLVLISALFWFTFSCSGDRSGRERPGRESAQEVAEKALTARTRGLAFLEENKLEDAEKEFLILTELAPGEAIGFANLGLVYMRMGRYGEAEVQLKEALERTPEDADIRLNLASVYKYMNRDREFLEELEQALRDQPDHLQSIYRLAEYYGGRDDDASLAAREKYLKRAVEVAPANLVPRLHLIENQIILGKRDEAIGQLEEVRRIYPEFSGEAETHYRTAREALAAGRMDEALTQTMIFHNFLKLTNPYNQGVTDLQGFQGSAAGRPMFTFSNATSLFVTEGASILEALRFTDVTVQAGLDRFGGTLATGTGPAQASATHITTGDFNHDGTQDLYLGTYLPDGSSYRHFMLKAELGMFSDVTAGTGLRPCGEESQARLADFDNDGWFDLLILCQGNPVLYQSISEGTYRDVTREALPEGDPGAVSALYVDMDHDGDLDLFLSTTGHNRMFRNNSDGTFTDYSESSGLEGSPSGSFESCFGDFDDDGDIDLFTVNRDAPCQLFTNLREGRFREISGSSGLGNLTGKEMVTAGDYNNDGYLDLFVAGREKSTFSWYLNQGRGMFEEAPMPSLLEGIPDGFAALDATFFDFDNDGHQDLLIVGDPGNSGAPGGILLHNDGDGGFENVSRLLPGDFEGGRQVSLADYNDDGDLDIFVAGLNGGARLLRNDGGNANRYLKMKLVGVRSGSGKNNFYGIGAKVELRAGNLYQMQVVTEPDIYFGLADRSDVDVVRILWTNGTPQNIFDPGIEQALIEEQQLKGSCPFLYSWDGDSFEFVKDIMWRSALGMPMGIMGDGQTYAFADASMDYHKIPGEMLQPRNGRYIVQVTEELWETIYLDQVQLVAVDHPSHAEIYVDEQFTPPPYPPLHIHTVTRKIHPASAIDGWGNEVSARLGARDDQYVGGFIKGRYQGTTEEHTLVLDPGPVENGVALKLFLHGWIFPTDASINLALSQGNHEKTAAPSLQVINGSGEWETVIGNIGFPQGKDKTIVVDLEGKYLTGDRRVRIVTNMEIYWDEAFFSAGRDEVPVEMTRLDPVAADHHYRGFSRMYRKGGRYGPHWFDYEETETAPRWRDLTGTYTRYGDVTELLLEPDNKYIIANAGDETTIEFDAGAVPPLREGWTRDFLVFSAGWVKDGDMNTAEGNRVEPLPFHGMTQYPYGPEERYPDSPELREYHREYNTREVTGQEFRRQLYIQQ